MSNFIREVNPLETDFSERPERKVTKVVKIPREQFPQLEQPKAQKVWLECGHWLINGYGSPNFHQYVVGDIVRCRSCLYGVPRQDN